MTWTIISIGIIALLIAGYVWLALRIWIPVRRLAAHAEQITLGNFEVFDCHEHEIVPIAVLRRSMMAMIGHVRRAQEEQRLFSGRVTRSQEAERARIARELHDDTVQALVAIAQSMEMARSWMHTQPVQADQLLAAGRMQALDAVESLRRLIADLRPPALAELGLIPALRMQISQLGLENVDLQIEGDERRLDEIAELTLFRSAQESLQNVARHSSASRIVVKVQYEREGVRLTVQDDGVGFVPPSHIASLTESGHYGLMGIEERVQQLDGTLEVRSIPGVGTTLTIFVPTGPHDESVQPAQTVRDPVCSAIIEPHQAYGSVNYQGKRYYFCCPVCQGAFQRNPDRYLSA